MGTNAQVSLNGKTANELRELIAAKTVTAKVVVEFLRAKPKLRVPSQKLLEELTGAKPASEPKAEKTKAPEAAPEAPKAATKAEVNPLEARVSALETAVAILMAARGVEPKAEPTPEPVVVAAPAVEDEDEDEDEDDGEGIPTEGSVREYLNGLPVKELRQHAKECGIPASGSKETLVSAIIAKAYEMGEIVADGMYEQLMAEIDGVEVF